MNRTLRLVWSELHHAFVPTAETARRRGKRSDSGRSLVGNLLASALSTAACGAGGVGISNGALRPGALPTAPQVTQASGFKR